MNTRTATIRPSMPATTRRGSVVIIVIWTLALAAIIITGLQLASFRQSTLGRDAIERTQARWAARAGVESTISVLAYHTKYPDPEDAFAIVRDMELGGVAYGETINASWDIQHHVEGHNLLGPMDEHSKLNVNAANVMMLMTLLDNMWIDIADAIMSWISEEHDALGFGVGRDYYLSLMPPYEPRNAPVQNIAELELVAGVWPKYLRGEDWNLNSRLDPNENDRGMTFPDDRGDGVLDAGWSGVLTAYSVTGGATVSGKPRIYLPYATIDEVMERIGVTELQAKAIIRFGRNSENDLNELIFTSVNRIDNEGNVTDSPFNPEIEDLEDWQLRAVLDELTIKDPLERKPGRINLNTVSTRLLTDILEMYEAPPGMAEEIIYLRDSRPEGLTSMVDLRGVQGLSGDLYRQILELFDVRSNVYKISSKGRGHGTGTEIEIIAVVDRSTVPVRIIEYREQ